MKKNKSAYALERVYLVKIAVAATVSLMVAFYGCRVVDLVSGDMSDLLLAAYGGGAIRQVGFPSMDSIIACIMPLLLQLTLFIPLLGDDIDRVSLYVFTRTKKRELWLFKKAGWIVIYSGILYLAFFLTALAVGAARGVPNAAPGEFLKALGIIFVTNFCYNTLFTVAASFFAIKFSSAAILSGFISAYALLTVGGAAIPEHMQRAEAILSPVAHSMAISHHFILESKLTLYLGIPSYTLPVYSSVIYLVLLSGALFLLIRRWIRRTDLLF